MIKLIAASLALALGYAYAHRRKTPADPVGDWERTHDSTDTAYPESQQSAP
ncbi:MAG: hypothetical protein NVV69_06815 [Methyloversatilis sp.]|jgi:hypothetical protein|uniref:hypothetical protein n=1 Tax=Methyloversatilis TaxID=378210 RepID=UPI0025EAAA35|nr:hypothetical protein [Methyloversatilis sp.]MCR6665712.1 hypothetical protein [Methyloversatilis sp.]